MSDFTSDAERDQTVRLAMARQHLAPDAPPWEELPGGEQARALRDARDYLRAADNAGLTKRGDLTPTPWSAPDA